MTKQGPSTSVKMKHTLDRKKVEFFYQFKTDEPDGKIKKMGGFYCSVFFFFFTV